MLVNNHKAPTPLTVGEPPRDSKAVDRLLLDLRDEESNVRVRAYNQLRAVSPERLDRGWSRVRQIEPAAGWELDCFQRLEIDARQSPLKPQSRAICTVATVGFEDLLQTWLRCVRRFGDPRGTAAIVVFAVDELASELGHRALRDPLWQNVTVVPCRAVERLSAAVKGALYSAALFVPAETLITLECDALPVNDLEPLWQELEAAPPGVLGYVQQQAWGELQCDEEPSRYVMPGPVGAPRFRSVREMFAWRGIPLSDLEMLSGVDDYDAEVVLNGGIIAGRRQGMLELDARLRALHPVSTAWIEGGIHHYYAEEFLLDVIIGQMKNRVRLAPQWNAQIHTPTLDSWVQHGDAGFEFAGAPAGVLHLIAEKSRVLKDMRRVLGLN